MKMQIEYRQGRDPCVKFSVGNDRFIGYFPKNTQLLGNPSELEVMFTGILHHKDERGYYIFDKIKCVWVSPIVPGDIHFTTKGFECSGTMCSTLAQAVITDPAQWSTWGPQKTVNKTMTVTPGAVGVIEVSNVNAGWGDNTRRELIPVSGWARKFQDKPYPRLVGVDDWKYLQFFHDLLKKNAPIPFQPLRKVRSDSGVWYENDWIQYENDGSKLKVVTYMDVRKNDKQKAPPADSDLAFCCVDIQDQREVA